MTITYFIKFTAEYQIGIIKIYNIIKYNDNHLFY